MAGRGNSRLEGELLLAAEGDARLAVKVCNSSPFQAMCPFSPRIRGIVARRHATKAGRNRECRLIPVLQAGTFQCGQDNRRASKCGANCVAIELNKSTLEPPRCIAEREHCLKLLFGNFSEPSWTSAAGLNECPCFSLSAGQKK
jgi:hypothetical protein